MNPVRGPGPLERAAPWAAPAWRLGPAEQDEQCTITRVALESLVDQVPGMSVDWNNGTPIFTQHGDRLGLRGVNGEWTSPLNAVAAARRKVKAEDDAAKAELKAKGASDADIAAAEKLLRLSPADPPYFSRDDYMRQLDKDMAKMSGISDLLTGAPAPRLGAVVTNSDGRVLRYDGSDWVVVK